MKLPPRVRDAWLASFRAEIKSLLDMNVFALENDYNGEQCIPVKVVAKAKIRSDGMIDKLRHRITARGDLDKEKAFEDNFVSLAGSRLVKVFLAEAARRKRRVYQFDFISAYLNTPMRDTRKFIRLPPTWSQFFPEFQQYFGVPLLLKKAIYGLSAAGKLFGEEQFEFYEEYGFVRSKVDGALFHFRQDDKWIKLISYCDDCCMFASDDDTRIKFERALAKRFPVKFLGQLHWFLSSRITQHENFDITIDQARYAAATSARYLPGFEAKNPSASDKRKYAAPLPVETVFTKEDCSQDRAAVLKLEREFGFEYASAVGSLMWLLNTVPRLQFAVRKLARFMQLPGHKHFSIVLHTLHHVRCNHLTGITFYSDVNEAPVARLLFDNAIDPTRSPVTFTDSSWQDCVDTGRSTACYHIFVQGGVVDSASHTPDPVALSSAEAESNGASVATAATQCISMLVNELQDFDPDTPRRAPLLIDNQSARIMGTTFRDTKHTRHILRRYQYTRWASQRDLIDLIWIPGAICVADAGTKCLAAWAPTYILFVTIVETSVSL